MAKGGTQKIEQSNGSIGSKAPAALKLGDQPPAVRGVGSDEDKTRKTGEPFNTFEQALRAERLLKEAREAIGPTPSQADEDELLAARDLTDQAAALVEDVRKASAKFHEQRRMIEQGLRDESNRLGVATRRTGDAGREVARLRSIISAELEVIGDEDPTDEADDGEPEA